MTEPTTTPDELTLDFIPRAREGLTAVQVEGELIIYEPDYAAVHRLDALGSQLWGYLDGHTSLAELAGELAAAFPDEDPQRLRSDLLGFARQLGRAGLLAGVHPASGGQRQSGGQAPPAEPRDDE